MPKGKILVIDDDEAIRMVVADFLEDEGFEVFQAKDGSRGVSLQYEKKPDLTLLDMVLPDTNGIEALKQIKKNSPEAMVIMMSGVQEDASAKQAIALGAYDYITKPVSMDKLKEDFLDRIFS